MSLFGKVAEARKRAGSVRIPGRGSPLFDNVRKTRDNKAAAAEFDELLDEGAGKTPAAASKKNKA